MSELTAKAKKLLESFKGDSYAFGLDVLDRVGQFAAEFGTSALMIADTTHQAPLVEKLTACLEKHGVSLAGGRVVPGPRPNAPREDMYRIETYILHYKPDSILAVGGGSTIDASKAANVLASLGEFSPEIDSYFGTGIVTDVMKKTNKKLFPLIAVQTAASSGAHLTKYSNITDPIEGQKKLIVDDAIVPTKAVFDYTVTKSMPLTLTIDGALDAMAHCVEVFYGISEDKFPLAQAITETALGLILKYTKQVIDNPEDPEGREALGLAADLGGYAIMIGGTNGPHLTSFSLVDVTSHGRACGIMNPYYMVFFAPSVERQLRSIGQVFQEASFISDDLADLSGRELGLAVANGMRAFAKSIGAPTTLSELPRFTEKHIERALNAAKDPQLSMKLKNMPVPLDASQVDEYMEPILRAAQTGDFSLIKNMR